MTELRRTDTGSRLIKASAETIYRALVDPEAVTSWRPPQGMRAEILAFEPREGGTFRMAFIYEDAGSHGKTSDNADVFEGRFVELVPNRRVVEVIEFESDDPAFAGAMRIVTTLEPVAGDTWVTVSCEDVPPGISEDDHREGIASSLANLAAFTES
ncbi:SRPBCC family protein [Aminobacter sp. MET-1]|uniref:SRPBCC family protein n=1 Tax=Aminobacter sp. MET-1 TaxID=2951085 RepID=UPI00226ADDC7|nr:SRPBCC family protein [Aminobacter sp. MET-1]MCX8571683.1 SRPBCC family protein [Aminobacter sp. MET-1]